MHIAIRARCAYVSGYNFRAPALSCDYALLFLLSFLVDGCECLGWRSVPPRVSNLAQVLRPSDIDQDLLLQFLPLSLRGPESCGRLIETRNQRNSMRRGHSRSTATKCLRHSCYLQLAQLFIWICALIRELFSHGYQSGEWCDMLSLGA